MENNLTLPQIIAIFGATLGLIIFTATSGCVGIDPVTGLSCEELVENPNTDIYFIVDSSDFGEDIWETAQQNPETVRWNPAQDKFIIKYNASEVPRNESGMGKPLNNPMTIDELKPIINSSDWIYEGDITKEETVNTFADPNI